ncbi:MAG: cystathionine gamma-synthase [Candidatus Berkiella sp.]
MAFKKENARFATKAIHAGFSHDETTGAVMPPIVLSSTFAQRAPAKPIGKYEYSRTANPTRDVLENNLAALENGRYGLCFASGCAALNTLLQVFPTGSHVVLSNDVYGGTLRLLANVFNTLGFTFTQCDMTNIDEVKKTITQNTKLIWLETPSNPLLQIIDIETIAALKQYAPHLVLAVDNTFATPYLQNPLEKGADIVCHSTTKYLGGHSDVVGGAIVLNDETLAEKLYYLQNAAGAIAGPMDCYLVLRSIKTLHVRMQAHCLNAQKIAAFLSEHPKISKVIYPGLSSHPQHDLAKKQMRDFGGMLSIVLKEGSNAVIPFLQGLKIFTLAESLGGVESLIEHPASMTHAAIPLSHRKKIGIDDALVRISVGIEDVDDLIEDLKQALL